MKRTSSISLITALFISCAGFAAFGQTSPPNDPACADPVKTQWLRIINAWPTIQRSFGPNPPAPLVPEVNILFVGTPPKSHEDIDPHVRKDLEVNFNEDGARPDNIHETAVASTAIAKTNNNFGVCSVAGNGGVTASFAIIVDNSGTYPADKFRRAIRYAIDKKKAGEPVEIIAAAFGGGDDTPDLTRPLIREAAENGIVIVAAAGTEAISRNLDQHNVYPAAYSREFWNVVVVAALNSEGTDLDRTSNYGSRTVHLAAAGQVTVVSFLDPARGGASAVGSSMGVGQVAGALALIKRYKERDSRKAVERLFIAATPLQPSPVIAGEPKKYIRLGKLNVDDAFTVRADCLPPSDAPTLLGWAHDRSRAAALDAASLTREPFAQTNQNNLGADKGTRLMLYAQDLQAGDDVTNVAVTATDSSGQTHSLPVEALGRVPNTVCIVQINVALHQGLPSGDIRLTLTAHGKASNTGLISIK